MFRTLYWNRQQFNYVYFGICSESDFSKMWNAKLKTKLAKKTIWIFWKKRRFVKASECSKMNLDRAVPVFQFLHCINFSRTWNFKLETQFINKSDLNTLERKQLSWKSQKPSKLILEVVLCSILNKFINEISKYSSKTF